MSKPFYSTTEVANLFNVNRVTVYRWAREGKIKAYEVGRHLKIPVSEVGKLIKNAGFSGPDILKICDSLNDSQLSESVKNLTRDKNGKKLVVAVGDDKNVLEFIQKTFAETDLRDTCKLLTFSNSLEAAIQVGGEKPDLVLINEKASGPDRGGELAAKIKTIYHDVKIVFMFGNLEIENIHETKKLEGFDYLIKPTDHNTLYKVVFGALGL